MTKPNTFPKHLRLRHEKEIAKIFRVGTYRSLGVVRVKYRPTDKNDCRFLISVSKKVGNAPQRNRLKRLVREAVRLQRHQLQISYDFCFFIKQRPRTPVTFSYIENKIRSFFSELNRNSPHTPPENASLKQ